MRTTITAPTAQESVLAALASEINEAHDAFESTARRAVEHFIECGTKLLKVKASLGHGNFTNWMKANLTFGIRTAQRYMQAAERPKLRTKNDTVSFLTISAMRGAIADDTRDGAFPAMKKIMDIAGEDVAEDLVGPCAVATKSAIKALAEMSSAAIKNATGYDGSDSFRRHRIKDSVRRSLAAKRRNTEMQQPYRPIEERAKTKYEPIGPTTRCDECGYEPADRVAGCPRCGARGYAPADFNPTVEACLLRGKLFSFADYWPVEHHGRLAEVLRAFADELAVGPRT